MLRCYLNRIYCQANNSQNKGINLNFILFLLERETQLCKINALRFLLVKKVLRKKKKTFYLFLV